MKHTTTIRFAFLVLVTALMHPALAKAKPKPPKVTPTAPLYLYMTNSVGTNSNHADSTISRYIIGDGSFLQLVDTFPVPTEFDASYGRMDPSGRYFYNVRPETGNIVCYHVLKSGAVTLQNCNMQHIDGRPESISFDPTGRFGYVKDYLLQFHGPHGQDATHRYGEGPYSRIWQFKVAADGSLEPLAPAYAIAEEAGPQKLLFAKHGQFAYLCHSNGISEYIVNTNGTLTSLSPKPISGPLNASSFVLDPNGRYLYAGDLAQYPRIRRYKIEDDGKLMELTAIPIPEICSGQEISVDPTGQYAYIRTRTSEKEIIPGKPYPLYHEYIYQFHIERDGTFTPLNPSRIETDHSLLALGFHPDGKSLYCAFFLSNSIRRYAIHPDGTLQVFEAVRIPGSTTSEHIITIVRRSSP